MDFQGILKGNIMRFLINQKVLFKHCDPVGIVFYPRYFVMINDCVEAFFDEIGTPFKTLFLAVGIPTVKISTTFHAPSRHGDQLVISLEVVGIGTSSLKLSLSGSTDTEQRFGAESTLVYINISGRPQKWPDPIRNAFTPYLRSNQ